MHPSSEFAIFLEYECFDRKIKCAIFKIIKENDEYERLYLKIGYSKQDFKEFFEKIKSCKAIDEFFTTIWFDDGTWAELDYDGDELYWRLYQCPKINKCLIE